MDITSEKAGKLQEAQRAVERTKLEINLRDKVRNKQIRSLTKVEEVDDRIANAKTLRPYSSSDCGKAIIFFWGGPGKKNWPATGRAAEFLRFGRRLWLKRR